MRFRWIVVLAATAGCLTTTAPDPSLQTIAAIGGQVTRTDGTPVGGPVVSVTLLSAPTGGSARLVSQSSVIGDANGRFLFIFLITGEPVQTGSATVSVTPPIGSSLSPRDSSAIPVKFVQGRLATDTTHVQFPLAPR